MKCWALLFSLALLLLGASLTEAQTTGRVECARTDGYIYLYSSMTTLDVRTTLQCGETVQITGRFDSYFAARTSKGEVGYVPIANIVLLKDQTGTSLVQSSAAPPPRERTPYDARPAQPAAPPPPALGFALAKDTPIRVKLLKPLSSATAHRGDAVEFEVLDEIAVDGVLVIAKGAKASGKVGEVEMKKHFGHDGKVSININSVHLTDNENAPVRGYFEAFGSSVTSSGAVVSLSSGKDALFAEGTEFTARIDGDVHLKREAFVANSPNDAPASLGTN